MFLILFILHVTVVSHGVSPSNRRFYPSSAISVHEFTIRQLDPVLEKINCENKHCVLMGDFNIDLLKLVSHNDSSAFYNSLSSPFFHTLYSSAYQTSLYLIRSIFFNSIEHQSIRSNLLIEISDHLTQFLILQGFVKEKSLPETNLFRRDFSNFNEREFEETILNMNWNKICKLNQNEPSLPFNKFFNSVTHQLDEFEPFKKVIIKDTT